MNISFDFSITPVRAGEQLFRVQRQSAMPNTVKRNGLLLRPPVDLIGRFDLIGNVTAYMADSKMTALYESLLRRETTVCTMSTLRQRNLATFSVKSVLKFADIRAMGERYPVLVSQRYKSTQDFASKMSKAGFDGIYYSSAQHPTHDCVALFGNGIKKIDRVRYEPLVKPGSDQLLQVVVDALEAAQIPLIDS